MNNPELPHDPRAESRPHPQPHADAIAEIISSEAILRGRKEVVIRHGEEFYRLRLTRSGKLILQK